MKVITEVFLRKTYKTRLPQRLEVAMGQILTPAALDLLREKKVEVVRCEKPGDCFRPSPKTAPGGTEGKPDHLTHLVGQQLVAKDHPRIVLRGKLDSLQAELLMQQWGANREGRKLLADSLTHLLNRVRQILKAEVTGEPLGEVELWGFPENQIREMSHRPEKHFGLPHLLPEIGMGEWLLRLNRLRTQVREVEVAAVQAFSGEGERISQRPDLLRALNRMSSVVYVLMLRDQAEKGTL